MCFAAWTSSQVPDVNVDLLYSNGSPMESICLVPNYALNTLLLFSLHDFTAESEIYFTLC